MIKKNKKLLFVSSLSIVAISLGIFLVMQFQTSTDPTASADMTIPFNTSPSLSVAATGPYYNFFLPCTMSGTIQAFYTDGSFDTLSVIKPVPFKPIVTSGLAPASFFVVKNPLNGKTINYMLVQPQLTCSAPALAKPLSFTISPQVSGSYNLYYFIHYSSGSSGGTSTPVTTLSVSIPVTRIITGQTINLGVPQKISMSTASASIPTNAPNLAMTSYIMPSLSFYIPEITQTSTWSQQFYFATIPLTLQTSATPTPTPTPTNPVGTAFQSCSSFQLQNPSMSFGYFANSVCFPNPPPSLVQCPSGYIQQGVVGMNSAPFTTVEICAPSTVSPPSDSGSGSPTPISCPSGSTVQNNQCVVSNPPPPTPTTAISLNSKIQYKIFYQNGKTQSGIAQAPKSVALKKLDVINLQSTDLSAPSPVTDITYAILIDSGGVGVNISNPAMVLGGTVTVGGNTPFTIPSSDFKTVIVNDINFGLMTVDLPVATLQNEIASHAGPAGATPTQVSVTMTANGQFQAAYQGSTYNGQITDLSWTFPILYQNTGASTGGGGCAQQQGPAGINPNGGSPSSGQSFNCGGGGSNQNCNFGTSPTTGTCNTSVGFPSKECSGGIWGLQGCNTSPCPTGYNLVNGVCSTGTGNNTCPDGSQPVNGVCGGTNQCPAGQVSSGGQCIPSNNGSGGNPNTQCFLAGNIPNPLAGPQCNTGSGGSGGSNFTPDPNKNPSGNGGTTGFCTDGAVGLACLSELLGAAGIDQNTIIIYAAVIAVVIIISIIVIAIKRK